MLGLGRHATFSVRNIDNRIEGLIGQFPPNCCRQFKIEDARKMPSSPVFLRICT